MTARCPRRSLGSQAGVTRRQFLVGGGAVVAAAAVAGAVGWRSWTARDLWYRLTGAYGEAGALPPSYDVAYEYGTLPSRHVASGAEYGIARPPGLAVASPGGAGAAVCICLPSRGGPPRGRLEGSLRLGDFVADGAERRGVAPFAIAAVQAGDTYWHRRASGEDAMAMLLEELVPHLRDELGLVGPLAIMGWSMGGYGALRAAELRPGAFRAVCAVSPALWRSYDDGVGDAFDSADDYAANDVYLAVGRLRDLPVRLDCGRQDPFYAADREFAAALPQPPQGGFSAGGHNDAYWRRVAPAEIDFIGGALRGSAAG